MSDPTWVVGACWRCDANGLPVMWIGDVQSRDLGHVGFYACEPCMQRLEALIRAHFSLAREPG
ncbi:hypothetical protein ACIQZO_05955 [Streptomyces sp. NPDC097617]|uniref:hypothetical protein n=1 Tax=Streptomyces sp. NPDC097617 TaxID=3366091 RepID=UPI0037F1C1A5